MSDPIRAALVKRLLPAQGSVTCAVDPEATLRLYGEPCLWRGQSIDSASRHSDAIALADERRTLESTGKPLPKGRARRMAHRHTGTVRAGIRDGARLYVAEAYADALIAAEEEASK